MILDTSCTDYMLLLAKKLKVHDNQGTFKFIHLRYFISVKRQVRFVIYPVTQGSLIFVFLCQNYYKN